MMQIKSPEGIGGGTLFIFLPVIIFFPLFKIGGDSQLLVLLAYFLGPISLVYSE